MAIRSERVIEVIKREMKLKKMKYEDLADNLGMSLSGLKKAMAAKDLGLARLQLICEAIGVSLVHVLSQADDSQVQDVYLSEEQELLLLRSPEVFHLYWKLRFEAVALHGYIQSSKKNREEIRRSLNKLEKVGLLKINPRGDIEFSDKGIIRWNNYGPLVEHLNRSWAAELIESILAKKDPRIVLNLALLQLSEASLALLNKELREVVDRFSMQTQKDRLQVRNEKLKKVALLVAADEYEFVK